MISHDPKNLPGYKPSSLREYLYLQTRNFGSFRSEFEKIGDGCTVPLPKSGGMVNEEVSVRTRQPQLFFSCVSFRGDIDGWRILLLDYASRNKLLTATINEKGLQLSNGQNTPWSDCEIVCVDR